MKSFDNVAPIDLLPPELISEILLCCLRECSPETRLCPDSPPWAFGKVSRRWRSIALSTPALWTDLPHLTTKTRNQSYCRLLGTALKLSRPLPLSINLTASLSGPDPTPPDMPLLHDVIPHLHRCRELSLSINPFAVHELSNMSIPFDNLIDLSLQLSGRGGDWDDVTDHLRFAAPKLNSLSILNDVYLGGWVFIETPSPFTFQWFSLPWTGLTTFVASYISLDFAHEVLQNTPSLRELSVEGLYHSGADLSLESMSVREYPLQTLFLLSSTADLSGDVMARSFAPVTFLSSLKLPQLKSLQFDYTPRLEHDPITDLIRRSGCTLTALHIRISQYWSIEQLQEFLEIIPHIQDLSIRPPQEYTDAQLVLIVDETDEKSTPLLPELRNLTLLSSQITARGIHDLVHSRTRPSCTGIERSVQPLETISISIPKETTYRRIFDMLNSYFSNPHQRDDLILDHMRLSAQAVRLGNYLLTQIEEGKQKWDRSMEGTLEATVLGFIDSIDLIHMHSQHNVECEIIEKLQDTSSILSSPVFETFDEAPQMLKHKVDNVITEWTRALENQVPSKGWQHLTPDAIYTMRFETMYKGTISDTEQASALSPALEKVMARRDKEASRHRLQAQRPDIQRRGSTALYF